MGGTYSLALDAATSSRMRSKRCLAYSMLPASSSLSSAWLGVGVGVG